jgi:hypothetical protein
MKGQMFVLTIIFLTGLIFVVQENLTGYSYFDFSEPLQSNDIYFFNNVMDMFNDTMVTTTDCTSAQSNIEELMLFLSRKIIRGGFTLDLRKRLNCDNWGNTPSSNNPPLNLTVHVIGKESDTLEMVYMYHNLG